MLLLTRAGQGGRRLQGGGDVGPLRRHGFAPAHRQLAPRACVVGAARPRAAPALRHGDASPLASSSLFRTRITTCCRIERRQALSSYQDYHMLLPTGEPRQCGAHAHARGLARRAGPSSTTTILGRFQARS